MTSVTVILPVLDEAESVADCVEAAWRGLAAAELDGEILVIDNGSTDGSARLARDAGARVVRETVPGYGSALRRGIAEARGDIVVMADADGSYDLERLGELVSPVTRGEADLVIGARHSADRGAAPWLHRRVGTPVLSFLIRRASPGLAVRDSQSGYRAMTTRTARSLHLLCDRNGVRV